MIDKLKPFFLQSLSQVKRLTQLIPKSKWLLLAWGGGLLGFFLLIWNLIGARPKDAWDFAPPHLVAMLEVVNWTETYPKVAQHSLKNTLAGTPYFSPFFGRMDALQSLCKQDPELAQFFKQQKLWASLHLSPQFGLEALYYIPYKKSKHEVILKKILVNINKNQNYTLETRTFKKYKLTEVKQKGSSEVFTFLIHQDFIIGSFAGVLIEDVIRQVESNQGRVQLSKQAIYRQYFDKKLDNGLYVYWNIKKIPELLAQISLPIWKKYLQPLDQWAETMWGQVKLSQDQVHQKGWAITKGDPTDYFINIFQKLNPGTAQLLKHIPEQTALAFHLSFDNSAQFIQNLRQYYQAEDKQFGKLQHDFEVKYKVSLQAFYQQIHREIAICFLNIDELADENTYPGKILLFNPASIPVALKWVQELAQNTQALNKTLAGKGGKYQGIEYWHIGIKDLPTILLGDLFLGFEQCYVAQVGQLIVLADSEANLKFYIDASKTEKMWHKVHPRWLKNLEPSANFSCFVATEPAWNYMLRQVSENWRAMFEQHESEIKFFEFSALQARNAQDRFLVDWHFSLSEQSLLNENTTGYKVLKSHTFLANLFSMPWAIKPLQDKKGLDWMVQDYGNALYLLDEKLNLLWQINTLAPIQTPPQTVDWMGNKQPHYAVLTQDRLWMLDRNGSVAKSFPWFMPEGGVLRTLNVLEGDEKKNYLLVSNAGGSVFMFDKNKNLMRGWSPKRLSSALAVTPQIFQFKDKSFILLAQEDGRITLCDREGITQTGFPLKLNAKITNPIYIKPNLRGDGFTLMVLTSVGEWIEINQVGEVQKITNLTNDRKPNTKFTLLTTSLNENHWAAMQQGAIFTLLDMSGNQLFSRKLKTAAECIVQRFDMQEGLSILCLSVKGENKTYFLDSKGKEIAPPIQSTRPVALQYSNKIVQVVRVYNQVLSSFQLN
ncbi:MAG TPA: hypothetical protein DCM08_12860 [Microscillaceae bacterium]|nr:hypothetical protein [Microscillaceae bacterium]